MYLFLLCSILYNYDLVFFGGVIGGLEFYVYGDFVFVVYVWLVGVVLYVG